MQLNSEMCVQPIIFLQVTMSQELSPTRKKSISRAQEVVFIVLSWRPVPVQFLPLRE